MRITSDIKRKITCVPVLVSVLLLASCADNNATVVATVNGKPVYQSEVDAFYKVKGIEDTESEQAKQLLESFLEREALADQIAKEKLLDIELIDAEVREFRKQLLISQHMQKYTSKNVPEEAIRNYYQTHKNEFTKDMIKVSHILVRTQPNMDEAVRQQRLTDIHSIHSKLMQGQDFSKLARQKSEDRASAKNGGTLGWVSAGSITKEFYEKIKDIEQGKFSEPFETNYGFHIVRVDEPVKEHVTPYDKVKGDIRFRLRQKAKETEQDRLNSSVKIERKG